MHLAKYNHLFNQLVLTFLAPLNGSYVSDMQAINIKYYKAEHAIK